MKKGIKNPKNAVKYAMQIWLMQAEKRTREMM